MNFKFTLFCVIFLVFMQRCQAGRLPDFFDKIPDTEPVASIVYSPFLKRLNPLPEEASEVQRELAEHFARIYKMFFSDLNNTDISEQFSEKSRVSWMKLLEDCPKDFTQQDVDNILQQMEAHVGPSLILEMYKVILPQLIGCTSPGRHTMAHNALFSLGFMGLYGSQYNSYIESITRSIAPEEYP